MRITRGRWAEGRKITPTLRLSKHRWNPVSDYYPEKKAITFCIFGLLITILYGGTRQ